MDAPRSIRIIMAGGGTGGHLYPGLAVAEQLHRRRADLNVVWAATPRLVDRRLLANFGRDYVPQRVVPPGRNPLGWLPFYRAWRHTCRFWDRYLRTESVDAVLALGGYAAAPAARAAGRRGIPVGLLNPDALAGAANRYLMRWAQRIFTQWSFPTNAPEIWRQREATVGCPLRADLHALSRAEAARRLGLDASRFTWLVTGASLGAASINDALLALLTDSEFSAALNGAGLAAEKWQILHLAGFQQGAAIRAIAARQEAVLWRVLDYCDDMPAAWAVADLALSRAGAGTCAELTACGVPAILLPYPFHRDHHQQANAQRLCSAGAAWMVLDAANAAGNARQLKPLLLKLLGDPKARRAMGAAAQKLARPDAAAAVADWLLAVAEERRSALRTGKVRADRRMLLAVR